MEIKTHLIVKGAHVHWGGVARADSRLRTARPYCTSNMHPLWHVTDLYINLRVGTAVATQQIQGNRLTKCVSGFPAHPLRRKIIVLRFNLKKSDCRLNLWVPGQPGLE